MADAPVPEPVEVVRDDEGHLRVVRFPREPAPELEEMAAAPRSPREIADDYVRRLAALFDLDEDTLSDLGGEVAPQPRDEGMRLRVTCEKSLGELAVVSYAQTVLGLPIWQAALEVRVYCELDAVASANSTLHYDVAIEAPAPDELADGDEMALRGALGLAADAPLRLNDVRLLVFRYEPDERLDPLAEPGAPPQFGGGPPTLALPAVPDAIDAGRHYVVREFLFSLPVGGWGELHWRAFVEPRTHAVLYLRALVASASACVWELDPVSASGRRLTGCSPAADLDAIRTTVTLHGLVAPNGGVQALRGEYVAISDTDAPPLAPPTARAPFEFCFAASTNDFAAANAYVHYDGAYRLVAGLGFDVRDYFDGTQFPVPVDHAGFGTSVNASANGNAAGNGMGRFRNGLSAAGCPVGIAADVRVVLHEFGHALLWDHVSSPNFGWCHSAGDALGILLLDADSKAPDRFVSFPFTDIGRRHDRAVGDGWAWGGTRDDRQYGSEQILSTLLFRVYRSAGGDDADAAVKRFAARYLVYLIVKAIGTLTVTTALPEVYATALMDADESTVDFEGHAGGAWHKVIRWSFEQQGLYQPPGIPRPVSAAGAPPAVDVYIDDGRAGAYMPYLEDLGATQDVWCRNAPDGGTQHEQPRAGAKSHVYVRVRNRGTSAASGVTVRLYGADAGGGQRWPDGWTPATTAQVAVSGPIPPRGGEAIAGPFEWTPGAEGEQRLLAAASVPGDVSTLETVNGPLPTSRLVPLDNNTAIRTLTAGA